MFYMPESSMHHIKDRSVGSIRNLTEAKTPVRVSVPVVFFGVTQKRLSADVKSAATLLAVQAGFRTETLNFSPLLDFRDFCLILLAYEYSAYKLFFALI